MSFEIALSGINAVNSQLGHISNNIANSGTYGFKSSRANFASVYAGSQPMGVSVGSTTQTVGRGGNVVATGRALDAAIQGGGFFVTRDATGAAAYTRVGVFNADKDGFLVDTFGRRVQGYAAANAATGGARGAFGDISIPNGQIQAKASDSLKYVGNLSAGWQTPVTAPFDKDDPTSFNGSSVSTVYDSLGQKHTLTQYFVKTNQNEVTAHYAMDGVLLPAGTETTLSFDVDGQLSAPAAATTLALGTPAGAAALNVAIDYAGTTQFAGETTTTANASNGYAAGAMTGVRLEENGDVTAMYSNGQQQVVGTVALATFPNEDGLIAVSETSWIESPGSGGPLLAAPGEGTAGKLVAGSLEQSNVDMTAELVNLMTAQRNYQANTKVIATENQVIQALMQAV